MRRALVRGFHVTWLLATMLAAAMGLGHLALAALLLAACALPARLATGDVPGREALLGRLARLAGAARPADWMAATVGVVLVVAVLGLFGLIGLLLGMGAIGLGLALALRWTLDRQAARQRQPLLAEARRVVAALRQGAPDETVRRIVWEHCGRAGEPLFEALFGYEAVRRARGWPVDPEARPLPVGRWRDPIVQWLDTRIAARLATDAHPAQAASEATSEAPATEAAPTARPVPDTPDAPVAAPPATRPARRAPAPRQAPVRLLEERRPRWARVVPGPAARFLVGALLVGGSMLWMHQNDLIPTRDQAGDTTPGERPADGGSDRTGAEDALTLRLFPAATATRPLALPLVPLRLTRWFSGDTAVLAALAGLVLAGSAVLRSAAAGGIAIAAAVLIWFGHPPGMHAIGPVPGEAVGAAAGLALLAAGLALHGLGRRLAPLAGRGASSGRPAPHQIALVNARGEIVHGATTGRGDGGHDAPRLLRRILATALRARASDIHIEPTSAGGMIRMRVDGDLVDVHALDAALLGRLRNLVKVLADINIAGRRGVQEGQFTAAAGRRRIGYRASFTPSVDGQKLALRVLDAIGVPRRTAELMLPDDAQRRLTAFASRNTGMLLVSGPTGSGKTTTLYAMLHDIDIRHRNVITIEDPVERRLDGVTQIQVDERVGHTFDKMLRSVLHQDPDVILVGEIRDPQTAAMAMQAAMTGHLVLSTIHARDGAGTIARLLDLGVEPSLLGAAVNLIVAQRLVRRLCRTCRVRERADAERVSALGAAARHLQWVWEPRGCGRCLDTGFAGRHGLFEMLVVDDAVRSALRDGADVAAIAVAAGGSLVRLADMGVRLVADGTTSLGEVERAIGTGERL